MKSLRSSSGDFVQKADWQAALNWLTFCSSVKRGLPIIAPAHQRQSNTRLDDSGYAEHWWKDDESEKRGVLWRSETISTAKWDSFLKLAWKQAIGWKHVIDCFGRFQKNSLKRVQCAMPTHTRDVIFSFIDFLPEFELLLCCGKVCEFCVCVSFLIFLEGSVCLKETDQERIAQEKKKGWMRQVTNFTRKTWVKWEGGKWTEKIWSYLIQRNVCVLVEHVCRGGQVGRLWMTVWSLVCVTSNVCHETGQAYECQVASHISSWIRVCVFRVNQAEALACTHAHFILFESGSTQTFPG